MHSKSNISLSTLYKNKKSDRDIFQELMPFKVKEILLFATLYDSYTIIKDGQFYDRIFGEYLQLNLYAAPRFTSVTSQADANSKVVSKHFDMIIIAAGVDRKTPLKVAEDIHFLRPNVPILLLVNNNSDIAYFKEEEAKNRTIDRMFVWKGNSSLFVAMVKYIEDKRNVYSDTKLGNVRVILMVEDSPQYYSRYLPIFYSSIMKQTQDLVDDAADIELHKIMKMRARPKVLLVSNYEDAIDILIKYKNNISSVISDVTYEKCGVEDNNAGTDLLKYVRENFRSSLPVLLQSHDVENRKAADKVDAAFIDKNSIRLASDIFNFINEKLGFGNFKFMNSSREIFATAPSIVDFEQKLLEVPDESILFHASRNSFYTWLMARGEINIADRVILYHNIENYTAQDVRDTCINAFRSVKENRLRGKVINFNSSLIEGDDYICRIGNGSLGGKGRGLAFISDLLSNIEIENILDKINIKVPATTIICTEEFDIFMEENALQELIFSESDHSVLESKFINSELNNSLKRRLVEYLEVIKTPIAIRSSGLFEDSLAQPFSGIYATFMLPNNHPNLDVRVEQLEVAIKRVYASIYTEHARGCFAAIDYNIDDEKMAVVIQEIVGQESNDRFYPTLSGTAQSYNYYPFSYIEPEDGVAVIAIGLGTHVVGGEKTWRFCPKYPKLINSTEEEYIKDCQKKFYAIDLTQSDLNVREGDDENSIKEYRVRDAERDNKLFHTASTLNRETQSLDPGVYNRGTRVINFANILQYNSIPLASSINSLLSIFKQAMGTPVEIEFSMNIDESKRETPTLHLLQVKPFTRVDANIDVDIDEISIDETLMLATQGMGHGHIDTIRDVIWVDIDNFDRLSTKEIAMEIKEINRKMHELDREYILIGPGRWGTQDQNTGIPVLWTEISRAKIIIEMGLEDYPLDASLGSHFFHNLTSMNVGYFSVPYNNRRHFLNFDLFSRGVTEPVGKYIKRTSFSDPLQIMMDGIERKGAITL